MKTLGKVLNIIGTVLIMLALVMYLPITLPPAFGLECHSIIGSSMEPAIPVGSLVYSRQVSPLSLQAGDIIVFQTQGASTEITHRITEIDSSNQEITTKGDANDVEDLRPVSFSEVIGLVVFHVPLLGYAANLISSTQGKAAIVCFLVAAVILTILGQMMLKKAGVEKSDSGSFTTALITLLACITLLAGYKLVSGLWEYKDAADSYNELEQYVTISSEAIASAKEEQTEEISVTETESEDEGPETEAAYFPWTVEWPQVDFDSLYEVNESCVGWIYLEDTKVNYPIAQSTDNNFYLKNRFNGSAGASGSIFLDFRNSSKFDDLHCILYGHHMNDGSMFAGIAKYKKQEFYNEHPIGFLITPEQNYVIEFFSGYISEAQAEAWIVQYSSYEEYGDWLARAKARSMFQCDVTPTVEDRVITLSTCTYEMKDARFVLLGILRAEP